MHWLNVEKSVWLPGKRFTCEYKCACITYLESRWTGSARVAVGTRETLWESKRGENRNQW